MLFSGVYHLAETDYNHRNKANLHHTSLGTLLLVTLNTFPFLYYQILVADDVVVRWGGHLGLAPQGPGTA